MIYEITTLEQFKKVKSNKVGFIVIVDNYNQEDNKIHTPDCRTVMEEGFQKKVLNNNNKTGNYFYSDTIEEAKTKIGARECKICKPQ